MFDSDPQIDAMVTYHQEFLLAEAERRRISREPSPLRVAIGLMLIRLGEQMRGCAQSTAAETPPVPVSRLRPAHQS
jgi:hypothetical protein